MLSSTGSHRARAIMSTDKSKLALPQAGEVVVRVPAFAVQSNSYRLPAVDQLSREGVACYNLGDKGTLQSPFG